MTHGHQLFIFVKHFCKQTVQTLSSVFFSDRGLNCFSEQNGHKRAPHSTVAENNQMLRIVGIETKRIQNLSRQGIKTPDEIHMIRS